MATVLVPDVPTPSMEPSSMAIPQPHLLDVEGAAGAGGGQGDNSDAHISQQSQQSQRSNPPPNPPFVFPARVSPSSAPSSYSRASGRRPKSFAADSIHLGPNAGSTASRRASLSPPLPDFSFNPGAVSPRPEPLPTNLSPLLPDFKFNPGAGMPPTALEHPFLSPPQSPHTLQTPPSPRGIPARPGGHGHKRGGSEFVGGQIRSGDAITVFSTSPTKSESGFAPPLFKPSNPRRGHAHRRSAAISSHDLSIIMDPAKTQPRGSSAPSSPVVHERVSDYSFPNSNDTVPKADAPSPESAKAEAVTPPSETLAVETPEEVKPQSRPVTRARVGFSDTLEFIPRPLSLVSSDTSSTMTARPGHSLSGSISSLISLNSIASHDRDTYTPSRSSSRNSMDPRPSTAGAVLERSMSTGSVRSPPRRNSIPHLNTAAANATVGGPDSPSPGKAPKRWSFFGLEPFTGSMSPPNPRRSSSSSSESVSKKTNSSSSSIERSGGECTPGPAEEETCFQRTTSRKGGKVKKKKVRSWAGSILTKKSKSRHGKKPSKTRFPPVPSVNVELSDDDVEGGNSSAPESTPTSTAVWDWRPDTPPEDEEPQYPMIDLDAALGPFNTPLPRNPEWEAAQRASGLTKRPLHSAARLGGFSGPGHHRRAESAPEMPPFNRAGLPRFNSNSTMADVFEEEEEEDSKNGHKSRGTSDSSAETPADGALPDGRGTNTINIRVTPDRSASPSLRAFDCGDDDAASSRVLSRKGSGLSGLSDDERQPSMCMTSEYSASSLHDEIIMEESPGVVKWNGKDSKYILGEDGSSDSATPSPRRLFKGKDLAPVDVSPLHLPTPSLAPVSPYSISHASSFPSPRSPMSYEDGKRISTAPSSVTEDNFQSLLMGEPGPEVRISMEIPSLTSSNSTMTRESAFVQQLSQAPARGERPASFSSPFGRRGSLASIGRLISTSHGERSKLSMEVSLESGQIEKKQKQQGKVKRLSRLMQFWKPKEGSSALQSTTATR